MQLCSVLRIVAQYDRKLFFIHVPLLLFTARKWSLGQGNVFTPVYQSFCSQRGVMMSLFVMDNTTPGQHLLPRQYHPWTASPAQTAPPPGQHCTLPWQHPSSQQVGGTHPTGMLYFYQSIYIYIQPQLKKSYFCETNNWTQNRSI